jgi:ABC-type multidrug transport system fused ATPase/permease subunit
MQGFCKCRSITIPCKFLPSTTFSAQMVANFAQTEQNMNSVERVIVYSELRPEGDLVTSNDPPPSWPPAGAVTFHDVNLAYREGLPLVLKDVSFNVNAGEKVSIYPTLGQSC